MNDSEIPTTSATATATKEEVLPLLSYCLSDDEKSALCKSYEVQIDVLKSNLNLYSEIVDEKERKIEK
jgi:hypothetical protein